MFYNLKLHKVLCQLYLNKAGKICNILNDNNLYEETKQGKMYREFQTVDDFFFCVMTVTNHVRNSYAISW